MNMIAPDSLDLLDHLLEALLEIAAIAGAGEQGTMSSANTVAF